jgi:hypothetical protein
MCIFAVKIPQGGILKMTVLEECTYSPTLTWWFGGPQGPLNCHVYYIYIYITQGKPKEPKGTQWNQKDPKGTQRNPKEHKGTQRNQKEPKGTQRNPKKSKGAQRNPKDPKEI